MLRGMITKKSERQFWAKVERGAADECWLWRGAISSHGYGQCRVQREKVGISRSVGGRTAHRVAFELTFGWILKDHLVCHTCDVRLCCNPSHLFQGTNADNMRDMAEKGRGKGIHSKLTADDRGEIRRLYGQRLCLQQELAQRFGVDRRTVGRVVKGQ